MPLRSMIYRLHKWQIDRHSHSSPCSARAQGARPRGVNGDYELEARWFRAGRRKSGRRAQLWSRNQKDFTRRFCSRHSNHARSNARAIGL
jgi:hypothetical protein